MEGSRAVPRVCGKPTGGPQLGSHVAPGGTYVGGCSLEMLGQDTNSGGFLWESLPAGEVGRCPGGRQLLRPQEAENNSLPAPFCFGSGCLPVLKQDISHRGPPTPSSCAGSRSRPLQRCGAGKPAPWPAALSPACLASGLFLGRMVKSTKLLCKSPRGRGRGRGRVIRICCSLAVLTSCGHVHDGLKHHVVLAFLPSTLLSLQSGVWKFKAPGGLQGCASVEVGSGDPGLLFPPASVSLVLSPSLLLCLISPVPHLC